MKRKILAAAAGFLAAVALLCGAVSAAPQLSARSAVLLDGTTGRILCAKDAEHESLIASTTKIMTGLLAAESCDPAQVVTVPPEAAGIEGSSLYLRAGEQVTVRELLYGLMLQSGNDAAVALAVTCAGNQEAFVRQMNARARELGLRHTHFDNPHGLDSETHYSTAEDLGRLAMAALENDLFREVVSTKSITIGSRSFVNHNKLLRLYDGAMGVKTGYTKKAGRILVSAAERGGRRLIAVTISDPDDWNDHIKLLDCGFSQYREQLILQAGQKMAEIPVLSGRRETVRAVAARACSLPTSPEETITVRLRLPRFVYAPVRLGTFAGTAVILADGKELDRVPMIWQ